MGVLGRGTWLAVPSCRELTMRGGSLRRSQCADLNVETERTYDGTFTRVGRFPENCLSLKLFLYDVAIVTNRTLLQGVIVSFSFESCFPASYVRNLVALPELQFMKMRLRRLPSATNSTKYARVSVHPWILRGTAAVSCLKTEVPLPKTRTYTCRLLLCVHFLKRIGSAHEVSNWVLDVQAIRYDESLFHVG